MDNDKIKNDANLIVKAFYEAFGQKVNKNKVYEAYKEDIKANGNRELTGKEECADLAESANDNDDEFEVAKFYPNVLKELNDCF